MKYAAIDIGSNTVLLLIAEVKGDKITTLYEDLRTPRLGKGVDTDGNLHPDSMDQAIEALRDYKKIIDEQFPDVSKTIITATSAVRDAGNKKIFTNRIAGELGFSTRVLSGKEEAACTFFGALSVLSAAVTPCCVIDIGGGSTEVAVGGRKFLKQRFSYDVGSVRFTERYLLDDAPSKAQVEACRLAIKKELKQKIFHLPSQFTLIGAAGTVTTLSHIIQNLDTYQPHKVNGSVVAIDGVGQVIEDFVHHGSAYFLERYPSIMKGRADVLLGGLLILEELMEFFNKRELLVSTGGIRHGALLNFLPK